jgi:hypothetical protein
MDTSANGLARGGSVKPAGRTSPSSGCRHSHSLNTVPLRPFGNNIYPFDAGTRRRFGHMGRGGREGRTRVDRIPCWDQPAQSSRAPVASGTDSRARPLTQTIFIFTPGPWVQFEAFYLLTYHEATHHPHKRALVLTAPKLTGVIFGLLIRGQLL